VVESALANRVVECAGQGGDAAAKSDRATAGGQLGADELVDVLVTEVLEPDRAEGWQEIVVEIVAVAPRWSV